MSFDGSNKYNNVFFDLNDISISLYEVKKKFIRRFEEIVYKYETCSLYDLKDNNAD